MFESSWLFIETVVFGMLIRFNVTFAV